MGSNDSTTTGPATLNFLGGNINLDNGNTSFIVGNGGMGTVVQNSTVTTGRILTIGEGAQGNYTVAAGSVLNIGNQLTPSSATYRVKVGDTSSGTLTIDGTLNATNAGTTLGLGTGTNTGTIVQEAGSVVHLGGNSVSIGAVVGGSGIYNQTGGTLTADAGTDFIIGQAGTGSYTISQSSIATFNNGFEVGGTTTTGTGTVTQMDNSILTANGAVTIGGATGTGQGTYLLQGGTAIFDAGLTIGATGYHDADRGHAQRGVGTNDRSQFRRLPV